MCSSISGNKSALCNPAGWCTDMAGENFAGLCNVLGNVAKTRIKSCKFYFKDHRNEKASKLDSETEEFKVLCDQLLESVTETQSQNIKQQLDLFISYREEPVKTASGPIELNGNFPYIIYIMIS